MAPQHNMSLSLLHAELYIDWLHGVPAMTGMDAPPTPRNQSAHLQQFSFGTASCAMIDMGSHMLSECRNRPYTVEDAAQPAISGEHVVQILPHSLLERANTFCAIDPVRQVSCQNNSALGCLIFMLICPSGTFVCLCAEHRQYRACGSFCNEHVHSMHVTCYFQQLSILPKVYTEYSRSDQASPT